ncbi:HK97 family phage prohead protease [Leisingera methylohalidivorans]|uniref:Peptidase U35 n=1 Tax=Leisingera methylohalidivorans DSM 14336 TaxID=999552 RepID=V9VT49_9RHOB|nr:HK97 family phage prohead protease [Leisingera methylohalidivorans]AHD00859.1 peptidase U35 [Leisingera methylohalidivorans DSM 14336]
MQGPPQLEHKFARFGEDLSLQHASQITGYASLFGQTDQGGDAVIRGAYAASLKALQDQGRTVKMLWQHDPAQPIGVWDEVREDQRGLFVKGRILTATPKGAEAAALIEAGAIDGLSIGYRTLKSTRTPDGSRHLTQLELWEVSLVTFPMLPAARVAGKSSALAAEADALRALAAGLRRITQELKAGQT